nr:double-stranded RNA-specific editase B2 [Nothobranchius furzeri]
MRRFLIQEVPGGFLNTSQNFDGVIIYSHLTHSHHYLHVPFHKNTLYHTTHLTELQGSSSLEDQEEETLVNLNLLRKYHPSTFCASSPRAFRRKQLLLFYQNQQISQRSGWAVTQKNALVHLNELRPGLSYEIMSKTGPLHAPEFCVAVEVNGFCFEGRGATKKQAKLRAAEQALHSFIQFPNASQAHVTVGNFCNTRTDFTADTLDLTPPLTGNLHCNSAKTEFFTSSCNHFCSSTNPRRTSPLEHLSPVAMLNELRPGLRYLCQVERLRGRPMRRFIMVVRLEGEVFEGCGQSKRQAKTQAAAAALQELYNIRLRPERMLTGFQGGRTNQQLPQFFAESIHRLVKQKCSQLIDCCTSSTSLTPYKMLAGVVMTRGFDLRSARVVSLATGTKCLDLDNLSDLGCPLTDCHAEVLSRRALVRFLYSQLELLLRYVVPAKRIPGELEHLKKVLEHSIQEEWEGIGPISHTCYKYSSVFVGRVMDRAAGYSHPAEGEEQSIFIPNKSCRDGFRLQEGVLFHMYVSWCPCGDARLNCPYETRTAYPSRRFCCGLRVKVNGGEGTLPISAQRANQSPDGALPGKPPISMSCTDKIAKWSVVGLQGALLSHLVEPVYLYSLTVGTLRHAGHLSRAMAHRLAPVRHVPFPYQRQQLLIGYLSSREVWSAGKAPEVSLNWSYGDQTLEEISTSTGKRRDSGTPSRLCRCSMFTCWLKLQEQLTGAVLDPEASTRTYSASKMSAGRYQRALQQFSSCLQGGGLGTWIRKPPKSLQVQLETN